MKNALFLMLLLANLSFSQNTLDEYLKGNVYNSYLTQVMKDSGDKVKYKHLVVSPLLLKDSKSNFDFEYLKDYIQGNIDSNDFYKKNLKPKNIEPTSYFDSPPFFFGRKLKENKVYGELLFKLWQINSNRKKYLGKINLEGIEVNNIKNVNKFNRKGWDKYKYCESYGIAKISDIIISKNKELACFYIERYKENLNASGKVIFMKKSDEKDWVIDYSIQFWIS